MLMRRTILLAVLGAGALGVAGCGGPDAGWASAEVGHLTLEHPSDWREEPPTGDLFTKRWVGDSMEIQVSGAFSEDPTASAALSRLDLPATVGLTGYEGGAVQNATVEGADSAVRSDFTFTQDGATRHGVWVVAGQYPYPSTAAVTITGETLDPQVVQHVVDTLKFTKTQGQ